MKRFDPEKLREARGERSLEDLAKTINVSRQTVSRWEKGETEPDASELAGIAAATGKPLEYFYGEAA
jgi:transcriptional regulator with XRE-family HTH domain